MFNLHYRLERKTIGFLLAIVGVASIGGAVEIIPLFTIHQTVEDAPNMRVYTPLEIAGRNIYIREGCYACHSQMIRTLRDEGVQAWTTIDAGPHVVAICAPETAKQVETRLRAVSGVLDVLVCSPAEGARVVS